MTLSEMHLEFKLGLDKLDTSSLPGFEPEEIDYLLNCAIERFINARYSPKNNRKQEGFEESQKRIDDLRGVTKTSPAIPLINLTFNTYSFILPDDYWYRVRLVLDITDVNCNQVVPKVKTRITQHHDINNLLDDPFNTSNLEDGPLAEFEGNTVIVYTDSIFIPTNAYISYIKQPIKLDIINNPSIQCELAEHTHKEIVASAISIALENIESTRYQSNLNELNKEE